MRLRMNLTPIPQKNQRIKERVSIQPQNHRLSPHRTPRPAAWQGSPPCTEGERKKSRHLCANVVPETVQGKHREKAKRLLSEWSSRSFQMFLLQRAMLFLSRSGHCMLLLWPGGQSRINRAVLGFVVALGTFGLWLTHRPDQQIFSPSHEGLFFPFGDTAPLIKMASLLPWCDETFLPAVSPG